jgi:hypothetical protein
MATTGCVLARYRFSATTSATGSPTLHALDCSDH